MIPVISKGALIRTIVLVIALVNSVTAMFGLQLLPIGEEEVENAVNAVYAAVSAILLIVAAVVSWWKNNNFTKKARLKEAEHERKGRELAERERLRNLS